MTFCLYWTYSLSFILRCSDKYDVMRKKSDNQWGSMWDGWQIKKRDCAGHALFLIKWILSNPIFLRVAQRVRTGTAFGDWDWDWDCIRGLGLGLHSGTGTRTAFGDWDWDWDCIRGLELWLHSGTWHIPAPFWTIILFSMKGIKISIVMLNGRNIPYQYILPTIQMQCGESDNQRARDQ